MMSHLIGLHRVATDTSSDYQTFWYFWNGLGLPLLACPHLHMVCGRSHWQGRGTKCKMVSSMMISDKTTTGADQGQTFPKPGCSGLKLNEWPSGVEGPKHSGTASVGSLRETMQWDAMLSVLFCFLVFLSPTAERGLGRTICLNKGSVVECPVNPSFLGFQSLNPPQLLL